MYRRAFLRASVGLGFGVSVSASAAAHDPTTTTDTTPTSTPTPTHTEGFEPLGSVPIPGATEVVVGADRRTAYVAADDGFAVVDLSTPESPRIVAERRGLLADRENGPMTEIQDVKVDGDRLLVVGPAHGTNEGPRAAFLYDVTDPADPVRTTVYEVDFAIHNASLDGATAYLTDNSDGPRVAVVDMERGVEVGSWSLTDHDDAWADVSSQLAVVHDVVVRDGRAYVAHWDAGTWLLDVSTPSAPTAVAQIRGRPPDAFAGLSTSEARTESWELPGNDHYAQPGPGDLVAIGEEAFDTDGDGQGGPGAVELWDASDPAAERVARIEPPPTTDASFSGVWTTAHNFDFVGDRLYTSWYRGGVRVHDVADPARPVELAAWRWSAETSFWTARLAVPGSFFVASSRKDPTDPDAPARLYTFPDPVPETTTRETAPSGDDTASGASGPGLGVLAGLAGVGAGAWAAWRRR